MAESRNPVYFIQYTYNDSGKTEDDIHESREDTRRHFSLYADADMSMYRKIELIEKDADSGLEKVLDVIGFQRPGNR